MIHFGKIGRIALLAKVFDRVLVPAEVVAEVKDSPVGPNLTSGAVLGAALSFPPFQIHPPAKSSSVPSMDGIGAGEAGAIRLAIAERVRLVLMDEKDGKAVARTLGLEPHGSLFVLLNARHRGLIDADRAVKIVGELVDSGLWVAPDIVHEVIRKLREGDEPGTRRPMPGKSRRV